MALDSYANKNPKMKTANYVTTKAMKMQNLSFNEKTNMLLKGQRDKSNESNGKKKRSVSPMTKGTSSKYTPVPKDQIYASNRVKSGSGTRKTNMRSPNGMRIY
jgi:hypothetical protein